MHRTAKVAFAALLGSVLIGCGQGTGATTSFSDRQIFEGAVFGAGPVAALLPEARDQLRPELYVNSPEALAAMADARTAIIDELERTYPGLIASFGAAARSGDPARVRAMLSWTMLAIPTTMRSFSDQYFNIPINTKAPALRDEYFNIPINTKAPALRDEYFNIPINTKAPALRDEYFNIPINTKAPALRDEYFNIPINTKAPALKDEYFNIPINTKAPALRDEYFNIPVNTKAPALKDEYFNIPVQNGVAVQSLRDVNPGWDRFASSLLADQLAGSIAVTFGTSTTGS
jgi:hypothetical protein